MKLSVMLVLGIVLAAFSPMLAQNCGDVNGDGNVDLSDVSYMIAEHLGGVSIPAGKGDIDYRQGYNAGDLRYLVDHLFLGGSAPACPPFPPYTLSITDDTVYLPSHVVPAGNGQFVLPIYMVNHTRVGDFVLPMQVTGLGSGIFLDSLKPSSAVRSNIQGSEVTGSTITIAMSSYQMSNVLKAGVNLLAEVYFHYAASPGGTISMDTVTLRPHTFLNYIYSADSSNYNVRTIGIPKVVVAAEAAYPTMTVLPDSLFFQALANTSNPGAQQISILANEGIYAWTLTKTTWVNVSATSGVSGQTVDVTPDIAGMAVGVYYGEAVVYSSGAIGSPRRVVVKLTIKQQFPSLDANCDGIFDISDVVSIVQYIFSNGNLCDPCTGSWSGGGK
jgi:hypothetical protein